MIEEASRNVHIVRRQRADSGFARMEGQSSVSRDERVNDISETLEANSKEHPAECVENASEDVRVVSVDRLTVEKIVLEKGGSLQVLLTKSESSKKLTERTTRIPSSKLRSSILRKRANSTEDLLGDSKIHRLKIVNGRLVDPKHISKLPICNAQKSGSASSLNEKRISPIKLTKSSSIGSLARFNRVAKTSNIGKIRKIPPKVPAKPAKKKHVDVPYFGPQIVALEKVNTNPSETVKQVSEDLKVISSASKGLLEASRVKSPPCSSEIIKNTVDAAVNTKAQERLEKSQSEIERLQQNLKTKINASTAETYKQLLPGLYPTALKVSTISDLDLNENVTKKTFDKEFLERHNFDTKLKIEEKRYLETDIDYASDAEKISESLKPEKQKYSKKVSEIEKRWSGEFLEHHLDHNSSESSYVEELGSVSSRESINGAAERTFYNRRVSLKSDDQSQDSTKQQGIDEILEDTVSTVDSDSCFEDRFKAIDYDVNLTTKSENVDDADESNDSTLKEFSPKIFLTETPKRNVVLESEEEWHSCYPETVENREKDFEKKKETPVDYVEDFFESQRLVKNVSIEEDSCKDNPVSEPVTEKDNSDTDRTSASPDGYANLIQEFKMEGASSKPPKDEKKKKSGLRRLLPGIFSPKDSRKEYKKEQKERKKREEKHFNQHQQNGIYSRSPDTMNLNEDITRNVKLDTSLNSSIIEERLNEIKQELFPDQGMTTSTPDHFLQSDRTLGPDARAARSYTVNSSLSSIAPDDKWLDHNIISGSPAMRKFKQQLRNENERKCSLERKHSLQESNQTRFLRNHGPSGRISAPPSERFLIRPRAVHPVDRPLPAIPQKVEFSNYQNHEEMRKHPNYFNMHESREAVTNYPTDTYDGMADNDNYENHSSLYENGNHAIEKVEINRNQSIDSGFNLTPVSAQVKITRQLIVNQNQKAPLVARTAKYSPSSSQKSGDYADSSYTPNSSQKSEFSPGSSKSGEYYLNSPRNSCRTSPDESFNERRDQPSSYDHRHLRINDERQSAHSMPYPVSPKINVQCTDDRLYGEAPACPLQEIRDDRACLSSRNAINQSNIQDSSYAAQRGSPNIPMSSNLAKLRANVENTTDGAESPVNVDDRVYSDGDKQGGSTITSPITSSRIIASPVEFRDPTSSHREEKENSTIQSPLKVMSPSRIQRIASPLTILTPTNSSPTATSMISPGSRTNPNRSLSPSISRSLTSPRNLVQSSNSPHTVQRKQSHQMRTPVSSPNMNQGRMTPSTGPYTPMSSFNVRRAQPNDQILIASPKRDASIYEARIDRCSSSKLESRCPDSPVPMADSPSQVLMPRSQISRHNPTDCERSGRNKTLVHDVSAAKEQNNQHRDGKQSLQRSSPVVVVVRTMSPSVDTEGMQQQSIQRPEPIYVRRQGVQRAVSPMSLQYDSRRDDSPVTYQAAEGRADTLLITVRQESRKSSSNQRQAKQDVEQVQQDVQQVEQRHPDENPVVKERIYVERRVQSPSGTPRIHSQRPEVIYVQRDRNLITASSEMGKDLDSSASSSLQLAAHSPQHLNQLNQTHMQMAPRSVGQINAEIYESRGDGRIRDGTENEEIYGTRRSQQSPVTVSGRSSVVQYPQKQDDLIVDEKQGTLAGRSMQQQRQSQDQQRIIYSHRSNRKEPIYGQRHSLKQPEPIYDQRSSEPIYGQHTNRQLSPSKRQMMQHLEAFYWQQKALDSQRKSVSSPTRSNRTPSDIKIDSPEVREAIYWQQLKKLDEEQQRRIFEENQTDERNENLNRRKLEGNRSLVGNPTRHGSAPSLANQSLSLVNQKNKSLPDNSEEIYWQNKARQTKSQIPVGKPPMMGQKGQNQPILVVRPQQAVRDSNETNSASSYDERDDINSRDSVPRSKSVSPHLTRGNERRSLSLPRKSDLMADEMNIRRGPEIRGSETTNPARKTPPIYEEHDVEGKKRSAPPPIFKRGSLISNSSSSVEYGTMGPKRVSFSNQANAPEIGTGNWPTKHGMAPEPPTRKHRSQDRGSTAVTSETGDSVFFHGHEENQNNCNNIYGNIENCDLNVSAAVSQSFINQQRNMLYEAEYDAKPLPPPPTRGDSSWTVKRSSSMKIIDHQSGESARIPRIEIQRAKVPANPRKWLGVSESESGSEAGEVQRILHRRNEEEWNPGGKGRQSNDTGGSGRAEGEGGSNDLAGGRRGGGGVLGGGRGSGTSGSGGGGGGAGGRSRDEPRRHTLSGDHQPSLHHQQFNSQQLHPLHPHHLPPPHGQYGSQPTRHTTMDLEMGTKSRQRKSPLPRGYPPPSSGMLFDDDPGIMSEVETSSTGFRRGGKQRSSLPVVRTPSKTLERPLGLVFLQYRNETKRALLPNEITSIDTVKALFVRSFPKQLTMEYLDSPHVKVYIHDSNKDMFYELEDLRSHLRDIRDRSVLRLFESTDGVAGMPGPMGAPAGGTGLPPHWEDQSYFSEPEFDSEFQHQHIHKSKTAKNSTSSSSGYYMGSSSTLPRGGPLMRAYSPAATAVVAGANATPTQPKSLGTPDRLHGESGYMSSPERGGGVSSASGRYPGAPYSTGSSYEEPYYSQYSGTVTPVIDEEARIRVEQMERQLANLTGLVQKALTHAPHTSPSPRDYLQVPAGRDPYTRTTDKSVSFEKSVSFSDEPPDMNSPKQHSPQHAERDRHKPTPPPKPVALAAGQYVYRDLALTPEMYNQLRGLQKKAKDLRQEVRNLRRMSQAQAHTVRETIRDTFITIRAMLLAGGEAAWAAGDTEKMRLSREEDLYKQEMIRLEKDLTELESTVEELRGNVINRKTRVNMSDVENMALILSKSSKTVADLKVRFPSLQEGMKGLLSSEMEKVVREEKFLKEEPERLESALRRCKKLTGTLVTLKRLASVQEQRSPNAASVDAEETPPITPTSAQHSKTTAPVPAERTVVGSAGVIGGGAHVIESSAPHQQRPENALDALLDELQTFSRPASQMSQASGVGPPTNHMPNLLEIGRSASQIVQSSGRAPSMSDIGRKGSIDSSTSLAIVTPGHTNTLRRLHSYPSSSDTDTSPPIARLQVSDGSGAPPQKPPVPERNAELLQLATARRVPPPPPPRTSSRSPLASPTSPQLPPRNPTGGTLRRGRPKEGGKPPMALPPNASSSEDQMPPNNMLSTSNSSSCESINSQEGLQNKKGRQEQLEQRHQELLRKQKALQEQYARLQQLQRNASGLTTVPPAPPDLLKKTGSESNLLAKMGLGLSTTSSGSLTSLTTKPNADGQPPQLTQQPAGQQQQTDSQNNQNVIVNQTTTSKIYETDIL